MPKVLEARNLSKSYNDKPVLKSVSFSVSKGEVLAVIGKSGAGKTTLIRTLGMLEDFQTGEVKIGSQTIGPRSSEKEKTLARKKVGVVFQDFNLWSHKTVLENLIEAPLVVLKDSFETARNKAKKVLQQVDLTGKENEYPYALSGGQRQRVAIARALAMEPEILLLDEITSSLDPELVATILKTIKRLAESGTTMIIVTHQIDFAREIADKVLFLDNGKVAELGRAEKVFNHSKNPKLREFLSNLLD